MVQAAAAAFLLLVLLVLVRLALEGAVRRWKGEFREAAGPARAQLDGGRLSLSDAAREAAAFDAADPAPYGPLAAELHRALAGAAQAHRDLARQRSQALRRVPAKPPGRLARWWFVAVLEPIAWWQMHRRRHDWSAEQAIQVPDVEVLLGRLRGLPVEVAGRCRAAHDAAQQARQAARSLRGAGLRGLPLDIAAETVRQFAADLEELPDYMLRGAEPAIVERATKEATIAAWRVVEEVAGPLQQQVDQLVEWQGGLDTLRRGQATLETEVALAERAAGQIPGEIEATGLRDELAGVRAEAQELAGLCAMPYADNLAALAGRLARTAERAGGLAGQAAGLGPQLERLRAALPSIAVLLDDVETTMNYLASDSAWPVDWGAFEQGLAWLRLVQARIGPPGAVRTPERLGEHLRLAERLVKEAGTLRREVGQVQAERETLIALLRDPALATGAAWLDEARATAGQAGLYAPDNWPAGLGAAELLDDAETLWRRLRGAQAGAGEQLAAAHLPARLEELRQVAAEVQPFRERLVAIAARLAELKRVERAARQEIEPLYQALARVTDMLHRGRSSAEAAGARQERSLADLRRKGEGLLSEMDRPDAGLVEDKAKRAGRWCKTVRRDLQALLQVLRADAEQAQAGLRAQLDTLRRIAPLDGERAVHDAARCAGADLPAHGRGSPSSLAAEAEQLFQTWQQASGLRQALQSQIEAPLQGPLTALDKSRQQAEEHYARLVQLKQDAERGWPPIRCEVERVGRRLQSARDDEDRLRGSGQTVSQVRGQSERIAGQYHDAVAEADDIQDRLKRDQRELEALAGRLSGWQVQLAAYRTAHGQEPAVAAAADKRLSQIQNELARLKQRWQGRPPYPDDARDALHRLWETVREDLWPEGDGRALRARDIERGE